MTHPVDTRATPAPKATRREWIGLAVIALPCVVYAMDLTVLDLALPAISQDLSPTSVQFLWIADIYGFFVAGALIPMGTLGDRLGRRRDADRHARVARRRRRHARAVDAVADPQHVPG